MHLSLEKSKQLRIEHVKCDLNVSPTEKSGYSLQWRYVDV